MSAGKRGDEESLADYRARLKELRKVEKVRARGEWVKRYPSRAYLEHVAEKKLARELEELRELKGAPATGEKSND